MLFVVLIINIVILICEILVLLKIKRKRDIFKYYTFLQNFLTAVVSGIFIIHLIFYIFFNYSITEYIKGFRYITTCGLITTSIIYIVFLSSNNKNLLSKDDFNGFNPKVANLILHYLCPILSLLSFVIFERDIVLTNSIWTGLAALPSGFYWFIYLILSVTKLWEEPYDLSSKRTGVKGVILNILTIILMPIIFIFISFLIWQIK